MRRSPQVLVLSVFSLSVFTQIGCQQSSPPVKTGQVDPAEKSTETPSTPSPAIASDQGGGDKEPGESNGTTASTGETTDAPLSREELLKKIADIQTQAMKNLRAKKEPLAMQLFREAGTVAEELATRFPQMNPQEQMLCANTFYNQACALALNEEVEPALKALERSIQAGWDNLDQINTDTDLAGVRALPEFAAKYPAWEQAIAEKMREEVAAELASFESYKFDFELPGLDAMPVKLADFRGKVVIVDIWGTWCPPCRAEIPSFVKLQTKYGEQGLQIIGLNYERTKTEAAAIEKIQAFREEHGMNYPCLIGDEPTRKQVPAFRGYPTTIFIDRTGKPRLQFVGLHPFSRLEAAVTSLLKESGGTGGTDSASE